MRFIGKVGGRLLYSDKLENAVTDEVSIKYQKKSANLRRFRYGPVTGGLIENIGFEIDTYGEIINALSPIFYKQRTARVYTDPREALLWIERVNANFAASHAVCFLTAIENACQIERTDEISLGRVAQLELERIRNHIFVGYRLCEAAGFSVPAAELLYLVEDTNRLISRTFGHRYFFGVNTLQGYRIQEQLDLGRLEKIVLDFSETIHGTLENRIFIDRIQECGVVRDKQATGPAARACGLEFDARSDGDYRGVYTQLGFHPRLESTCDAFGRLSVRAEEVLQSFDLIERIRLEKTAVALRVPSSEPVTGPGLARVESPSGDLAYYIELEKAKLSTVNLLSASETNIRLFCESIVDGVFTDLPFNWESFGIWVSEVGVNFR